MNISKLNSFLLNPKLKEHQFIKEIKRISSLYTIHRQKISSFRWSEDSISAYSLFYMITNMPKLKFLYEQLPENILSLIEHSTFVDFGSGPGTYSWQHLEFFPLTKKIIQIEKEVLMRKQAFKISSHFFPNIELKQMEHLKGCDDISTLLFGNSANEMKEDEILLMIKKSKCSNLIFIEPGTKEVFNKLIKIRDKLISSGFKFYYPCPSQATCPIKVQGELSDDWCHQVLRFNHGSEIDRYCQILKLKRNIMPTILWFLTNQNIDQEIKSNNKEEGYNAVLFRCLKESKHSFNWQVCLASKPSDEKVENNLVHFEVLKKEICKNRIKELKKASTGLAFKYIILSKIQDNYFRIKII